MVRRNLQAIIEQWLFRGKIIILYGARQVGKTTLVRSILENHQEDSAYYNCEIQSIREVLTIEEPSVLKSYLGDKKIIVFDEAQFIPNIGRILKLLIDTYPDLQIIATGSSSFELANQTSEALTGRALQFTLYPFSYGELSNYFNLFERKAKVDLFLQYGLYPEIVQANNQEARILLDDLSSRYLYKDILEFENLKKADVIFKLLQLLALQIGSEISLNELANSLKVNRRTVERYIELLEKAFVIFRLGAFSRNLRKEISKGFKIYFYDLGIRNSIVQQYQDINLRQDKGGIWENFLICERLKWLHNHQFYPNRYFWRTHDQQEIDYIEEFNGRLTAYEMKWKIKRKSIPKAFVDTYENTSLKYVDRENFEDFIDTELI